MAVRIKTISNDIGGARGAVQDDHHAHQAGKPVHDSRQTNKILELEWEALGKKLNKPAVKENADVEKLRRQLKDKDEQLKYAESLIARLKTQLRALQEKQQAHGQNKPAGAPGNSRKKPQQRFQRPPQKRAPDKGRK